MNNRLEDLLPEITAKARALLEAATAQGVVLKVTHTLRTNAEQDALFAKGRTVPGEHCRHHGDPRPRKIGTCMVHPLGYSVTKAPAGMSWHNYGRAFDVAIATYQGDLTPKDLYDGPWAMLGDLGESVGLEWGGRWGGFDLPHFQDRGGMTIKEARAKAEAAA